MLNLKGYKKRRDRTKAYETNINKEQDDRFKSNDINNYHINIMIPTLHLKARNYQIRYKKKQDPTVCCL